MNRSPLYALCVAFILACGISPPSRAAPSAKPFVSGSMQQIVGARKGKPFILSLWSLDCVYCPEELNLLSRLKARYPKLEIVLISTDTPEQTAAIAATLDKSFGKQGQPRRVESWVFADDFTERLRHEVDRTWHGELPRAYFYGKSGLAAAVSGQLNAAEVERWVGQQFGPKRGQ
ncbi:MAG: TlpA family protein disulfide reductase [Pseudomonadota bacterium]